MPAPAHQQFSSNSLDLSAPEEAYSRNIRASGTLKFGNEGVFKIFDDDGFIIMLLVRDVRIYTLVHLLCDRHTLGG